MRRLLFALKLASKNDSLLGKRILSDLKIQSKKNYLPAGFPLFLKSLKISTRCSQQRDSRILQLKYLVMSKLDLRRNEIEYLPDSQYSQASYLTSLKLGYYEIKVLPSSICNLNRLRNLKLTFLSMHIGRLGNLTSLGFCGNRL